MHVSYYVFLNGMDTNVVIIGDAQTLPCGCLCCGDVVKYKAMEAVHHLKDPSHVWCACTRSICPSNPEEDGADGTECVKYLGNSVGVVWLSSIHPDEIRF